MADSMKRRELLRLSVRWPLVVKTDRGQADGETRNITGEGLFLYCSERLHEGAVYPVTLKLPEERVVEMAGKVTWSNLDNFTSLNFNPAMGFYFIRIDDDMDRQSLRQAIIAHCKNLLSQRRQGKRLSDSRFSVEEQARALLEGIETNSELTRN